MCEKRARRIKKGSLSIRLREARRIQRIQRMNLAAPRIEVRPVACQPLQMMDKELQSKVLLQLAWKTVLLMHRNKLIQQKLVDLQKETTDYVTNVMTDPENRKRYLEHLKLTGIIPVQKSPQASDSEMPNSPLKLEPKVEL